MDNNSENFPIWSVSEFSGVIKRTVEENLDWVRIRGEISGLKEYKSGLFFSLKDQHAKIEARCWRSTIKKLKHLPEDGMEVIVSGKINVYPPHSNYSIVIEELEPAGEGALLKLLEERKRKFSSEGLFDADLKKPLPFIPYVIGVVTSPNGAVIKDILHRIEDRLPSNIILWPASVQGQTAAGDVSNAIRGFNALDSDRNIRKPDLIIVARGGGSIEDLWAFNEEEVVRAVAESIIPVISAVGHETDTTLIDLVADRRAPTPSAAAEMAVPERRQLLSRLADRESRLFISIGNNIVNKTTFMAGLLRGLPDAESILGSVSHQLEIQSESLNREVKRDIISKNKSLMGLRVSHPRQVISFKTQIFNDRSYRLVNQLPTQSIIARHESLEKQAVILNEIILKNINENSEKLSVKKRLLENLSYRSVLARGFTVVRNKNKHLVSSAQSLDTGSKLLVEFHDGIITTITINEGKVPKKYQKLSSGKKQSKDKNDDKQGKLL